MRRALKLSISLLIGACLVGLAQSPPASYSLQTIAGGDYAGDGGPATGAVLVQLEGVAAGSQGNIYVVDAGDNRVRKIAPNGIISTVAGTGHAGFSGDGGPANAAQLRTPYGIACDRNGNLYIADLGNARIRRVKPDGTIETLAGGGSTPAAQAESGPATGIALSSPRNVAIDTYGTLYFSDFGGNRVYQVSQAGTINLVAGTGDTGAAGDGGAAVKAQLSAPAGLALDAAGALYIADTGNARIRKVYRGVIGTLGDGGAGGAKAPIPVSLPIGVALDPDGSLFIADAGGNQILRVTPALATSPVAQPARDVAVDAQSNLYASTGAMLYKRPRMGGSSVVAGGSMLAYTGDGATPSNVRFAQPSSIARDASGNLYVADTGHHRIRKIDGNGAVTTVAGTGVKGFSGDGAAAVYAQLNSPVGVIADAAGDLYISDTGNQRIRKVTVAGIVTTIAGTGAKGRSPDGAAAAQAQLNAPAWLALNADGSLVFSETGNHDVRVLTVAGQIGTIAGIGTRGSSGDGGPAVSAALDTPQGIAIDAMGNIYIADSGNRRIRFVAAPSAYGPAPISTMPEANAAIWRNLQGLAIAPGGGLFASDAVDARIFRVDAGGRVLTIAGTGTAGFSGEAGSGLAQLIDTPMGIAADPSGAVYLVDSGNGRVRKLNPASDAIPGPAPPPSQPSLAILNAASLQPGSIAPGEIVSIFGASLGPGKGVSAAQPSVELGGTQVVLCGRLAPLFYAGPNQVNVQVPYSLNMGQACEVQVLSGGLVKARGPVGVVDAAPAIFTVQGGSGAAAALNEDGELNSPDHAAERGSTIVLFATGEGQTTPNGVEGRPAGAPAPVPVLPVKLTIGGYAAEILYAGEAPGFAGLLQVNARIPGGFLPPGTLPVVLQVGTAASQPGVTIEVR